ncbi:32539_t:CDS:2, partial [Gigaspora margarita]
FLKDDYEKPQILLGMALEDYNEGSVNEIWENEDKLSLTKSFQILEKIRGQQVTDSISAESSSKKASYGHGLGLCKKALDIAIANGSNQILENLLQRFINVQVLIQSKSTQELSKQG